MCLYIIWEHKSLQNCVVLEEPAQKTPTIRKAELHWKRGKYPCVASGNFNVFQEDKIKVGQYVSLDMEVWRKDFHFHSFEISFRSD